MQLISQLRSDLHELARAASTDAAPGTTAAASPGRATLLKLAASNDGYRVLMLTRLREAARRRRIPGVNHLLRMATTVLFSTEVGNDVTIGPGVNLTHTLGTVIGGTSVLGERVTMLGNNTIGTAKDNGCPVIGNDVTIGCGARVLGPVTVGDGAFIGANAVVLIDVPAGAIAAGVPAVIVKSGTAN